MTDAPAIQTDPTREYVAGGSLGAYVALHHALPPYIDDITAELGDDTYERMANDPQVAAALNTAIVGVLEDGVTLMPAITDKAAEGYALARELVSICTRMLNNLTIPLEDVLWDLMRGIATGSRVAENIWGYDDTYTGQNLLTLAALKPKPRRSTAFVVDRYFNVLGLQVWNAGSKEVVDREKFTIFTFRPHDSDPRGTSIARPAYNGWYLKQQTWPEYYKYLVQFASGSLVGKTAENASEEAEIDPITGETTGVTLTAEEAMGRKIAVFHNGTWIVLPFGAELDIIFSSGEGRAFLNAFTIFNNEILKGIVHQTLALNEGEHQARASSETHQDILDAIIRLIKRSLQRMLYHDTLTPFVRYNWGDAAVSLTPIVSMGETEEHDWATEMGAASGAGYVIDGSQFPALDQRFGLPARATPSDAAPADATPASDAPASDTSPVPEGSSDA